MTTGPRPPSAETLAASARGAAPAVAVDDEALFLHLSAEEQRVGLFRNGRLCDFEIERTSGRSLAGNIYRGRVDRIARELDGAFIDLGLERMGLLTASDVIVPDGLQPPPPQEGPDRGAPPPQRPKRPIDALLRVGQEVLVQVVREPVARKGPRVTMHIGLAGRNILLLPTQPHIGVSKMIDDPAERQRLFDVLRRLLPPQMGAIVRTIGESATEAELANDAGFLRAQWQDLNARHSATSAPSLLQVDLDLALRAIRDLVTASTRTIWIDQAEERARIERFVERAWPDTRPAVRLHDGPAPLFASFGLDGAVLAALQPRVRLAGGGELVIERTEAMTVVDVNSSQPSGDGSLDDAILEVNLEAAREVAHQLRLRNLGGLCVVDFIDMKRAEDRRMLEAVLEAELEGDPARVRMSRMNRFGLVELTRKRLRESIYERLTEPCPTCEGRGFVRAAADLAIETLERIRRLCQDGSQRGAELRIEAPARVAAILNGPLLGALQDVAAFHGVQVEVVAAHKDGVAAAPTVSARRR